MKGETIKPVFIEKTMNANELADELAFKHIAGDDSGAFSSKIITMLRQQQAEIEALKQRIERMIEKQSHYEAMAHAGGFEAGRAKKVAKQIDNDEYITPED